MELNITKLLELSPAGMLEEAHRVVAVPSILLTFGLYSLIVLLIGLAAVKESRAKFFMIWVTTFILGIILVVVPMLFMPDTVQVIADFFRNMF